MTASNPDPTKHDMSIDRTGEHISNKVYMFPESYNQLRKELHDNWPELWNQVGYDMAFNGPSFVEKMDGALGTITQFDSDNVAGMCARYLDELRVKRGLSRLHSQSAYGSNETMEAEVRIGRQMNEIAPWKLPPVEDSKQ